MGSDSSRIPGIKVEHPSAKQCHAPCTNLKTMDCKGMKEKHDKYLEYKRGTMLSTSNEYEI